MDPTKREERQTKREIKRAGSQRRRRQWKRDLRENPEEAPSRRRTSAATPPPSSMAGTGTIRVGARPIRSDSQTVRIG